MIENHVGLKDIISNMTDDAINDIDRVLNIADNNDIDLSIVTDVVTSIVDSTNKRVNLSTG